IVLKIVCLFSLLDYKLPRCFFSLIYELNVLYLLCRFFRDSDTRSYYSNVSAYIVFSVTSFDPYITIQFCFNFLKLYIEVIHFAAQVIRQFPEIKISRKRSSSTPGLNLKGPKKSLLSS